MRILHDSDGARGLRHPRLRAALGAALAAVLAHVPVLHGGFVWLDRGHISQRLALVARDDGSIRGWLALFTRGFASTGFYRPLVAVSLSIDDALAATPRAFHAVTLGWHALAAALVVMSGEVFGLSVAASLAAGLLFAVHPLTSEVAGAIAFRSEAMAVSALLVLLLAHWQRRPVLAGFALLAGALVKETALVVGPLLLVTTELLPASLARSPYSATAENRSRLRTVLWAEALALGAALSLRAAFAPRWNASTPALSVSEAMGTRLAALAKSGATFLLLGDRCLSDSFPITPLTSPQSIAGAVLAISVVFLAYRRRGAALGLALALLPSLQLVPVMRWWSPHYLYLPLVFVALLVGESFDAFVAFAASRRPAFRLAIPTASVAAVGLFAVAFVLSYRDAARFESDATLWGREVARHPECREAQFYLGEVAREAGDFDTAARRYERAIERTPGYLAYVDLKAAHANLGATRLEQRRFSEAAKEFRAALALTTNERDQRQMNHNLATATLLGGDPTDAARILEAESTRDDALPQSLLIRARALLAVGRTEEAAAIERRLVASSRVTTPN